MSAQFAAVQRGPPTASTAMLESAGMEERTVIELAGIFVSAFFVGLSGAAAPGPLLVYGIAAAARRGFIAGPLIAAGHALVELLIVIVLGFGLAGLALEPVVRIGVGLLGGSAMIAMGGLIIRSLPKASLSSETGARGSFGHLSPVLGGALVSLANPYFFVWWGTVGTGLFVVSGAPATLAGVVAFYLGHISSDFGWYSLVAGTIGAGRRFLSDSGYRLLLGACSVLLVGMGLAFAVNAIRVWGMS